MDFARWYDECNVNLRCDANRSDFHTHFYHFYCATEPNSMMMWCIEELYKWSQGTNHHAQCEADDEIRREFIWMISEEKLVKVFFFSSLMMMEESCAIFVPLKWERRILAGNGNMIKWTRSEINKFIKWGLRISSTGKKNTKQRKIVVFTIINCLSTKFDELT